MAEETNSTQKADDNSVTNPSTQAVENKETTPFHENPRFKEVIGQKNDWKDKALSYQQKVSEYEAKEKAKQEEALKEKGEFQTILDRKEAELKDSQSKVTEWENYKTARRQTHLEQLPDEKKEIYKALPYEKAEKYFEMETAIIGSENAGKADSLRAGTTAKAELGGYSTYAEWAQNDPVGYEKANGQVGINNLGGTVRES